MHVLEGNRVMMEDRGTTRRCVAKRKTKVAIPKRAYLYCDEFILDLWFFC